MKFDDVIAQFEAAGISVLADGKHSRKLSFAGKHVGVLYDSANIGFCSVGLANGDGDHSLVLNFTRANVTGAGLLMLSNNGVQVGGLSCRPL